MALGRDTARGALFTIGAGVVARGIGLVSTLALTHFISPSAYGAVTVAAVLVMTASQLSTLGLGQYLIATPGAPRSTAFHVTVLHLVSGLVAFGALLLWSGPLGIAFGATGLDAFLPALVFAAVVDRVSYVPERVLVRDMRFGWLSMARTVGELVYSISCLLLAILGWGPLALVAGNVARSLVRATAFIGGVARRDWLEPSPLNKHETRELLAFGAPMALGATAAFAARRWDNLLVAHFFGAGPAGAYNLAYNLADVPAIQVGEQIGDVLLPSFARLEPSRRPSALLRSMALLGLVVFPLAVGLGAIAHSLVAVLFDASWRSIGPMLVLLSALSVTRPVGWVVASYLQASARPTQILRLELFKLALLGATICTFGRQSPLWTCAAVGITFALHALASLWVVERGDGIPLRRSIGCLVPCFAACFPLVIAVLGVRAAAQAVGGFSPIVELAFEIGAGALGYFAGASVFAREVSVDLVARLLDAVRTRQAPV